MALPNGPEFGVTYVLTGPDGSRAVFNNQADADYVGVLTDISGFDSPEVRESADDLVGMDGGFHGDFFYGRRPITISGLVYNHATAAARNAKLTKLQQASNAMRSDCVLTWTPSGGEQQQLSLRRQQPLRISGSWNKEFQLALVAADPRIYSATLYSANTLASGAIVPGGRDYPGTYPESYGSGGVLGQLLPNNQGTADSFPIITVTGPGVNPTILNYTTGKKIVLNYTLSSGDFITIDTVNRTVILNGVISRYSAVDFVQTDWWPLVTGVNDVRLMMSGYSNPAAITIQWRNAWI